MTFFLFLHENEEAVVRRPPPYPSRGSFMVRPIRPRFSSTSTTHTVITSPHGQELRGVLHPPGQAADVDQAVLVDADVHEGAEVDDVAQL